MKAKELSIGNTVSHAYSGVINISHQGIGYVDIQDRHPEVEVSYLPIDISDVVLLKSGFEKSENLFTIKENEVHNSTLIIVFDEVFLKYKVSISGFWYEIKYFHQLQNLYHIMTGINLDIKP